jgi:methylation protein MtfA
VSSIGLDALPTELRGLLDGYSGQVDIADLYGDQGSTVYEAAAVHDTHEIRELIRATRGVTTKILEFAAGSGRLTLPLAAAGRELVGVDLSPAMVALLDGKLAGRHAALRGAVRTAVSDMTTYDDGMHYSTALLGCISISLLDDVQRARFFRGAADWLAADGVLLMSTTDTTKLGDATGRYQDFPGLAGQRYRLFEEIDPVASIRHVGVIDLDDLDRESLTVFLTHVRAIPPLVLEAELAAAGLAIRAVRPVATPPGAHPIVILEAVWRA